MDTDDVETSNSEIIFDTPNEDGFQMPTDTKTVKWKKSNSDMDGGSPYSTKSPEKISIHDENMDVCDENDLEDENINPSGPTEVPSKLFKLPVSRIKSIVKLVPSVHLLNSEATALIGRATEMFLNELVKESYQITLESGKKILTVTHIEGVIQTLPQFEFLDGMLT
ncbi:hypothetical protein Aperf_G00000027256 [Anoplocephala perfoliata]